MILAANELDDDDFLIMTLIEDEENSELKNLILQSTSMNVFLLYQQIKRRQPQRFKDEKRRWDGTRVVLKIDFAENFDVEQQNEIQSRHWANPQVSLFTGFAQIGHNQCRRLASTRRTKADWFANGPTAQSS